MLSLCFSQSLILVKGSWELGFKKLGLVFMKRKSALVQIMGDV